MSQTQTPDLTADRALKDKHRAMWALGDYPAVARDVIADLGPLLVGAAGVTAEDRVLDVAAGSGNVAIPAARTGARVVATDLTPSLLEEGRRQAEREGLTVRWVEADAEQMPCDDGEHDVVLSCVGVMFAPHHQRAADELVRVCRPGGRIGLISWTPEGFVGQLFATMRPYVAPPPPGVQPPPLWGREDHVAELLGDRVEDLVLERRVLTVDAFEDGAGFRDFFKRCYGPTIAAYRGIADDADRTAALDADLASLAGRFTADAGGSPGAMAWEYLLVTARRAG